MALGDLKPNSVISSAEVAQLMVKTGYDIKQLMIALLPYAARYAHAPISNYHVGAVAMGAPMANGIGNLYFGANMEFATRPLGASIHAEQSAINHALLSGETALHTIAVTAPPCGYCRQFLHETCYDDFAPNVLIHTGKTPDNLDFEENPLSYYLPNAFGPVNLNINTALMQTQDHALHFDSDDALLQAALSAAKASYAPYTQNYAGIALQLSNEQIIMGRLIENAAFNPTLAPLQSVLAYLSLRGLNNHTIRAAALVERAGAKCQQYETTKVLLRQLAPHIALNYAEIS